MSFILTNFYEYILTISYVIILTIAEGDFNYWIMLLSI